MAESTNKSLRIPQSRQGSPRKASSNHLFVVGIDDYTGVAKLNNAVRDAQAVRDALLEFYDFDKSRLTELYDEKATRQNIMQALRKMASELKENDNVILYFSGHGHYDKMLEEGYWVPVGANYDIIDDYISYSFIQKVVKAARARHILLIVDSCYSGAVLVRERDIVRDRLERDPSRWIIASGRNEVVPDGQVGGNSPFAKELIYLLENYHDSSLSTMSLVDKLTSNVIYNSRQTPIGQPLFDVGHRGGQFFFHPKKRAAKLPVAPSVVPEPVEEKPIYTKPDTPPRKSENAKPGPVGNNPPKPEPSSSLSLRDVKVKIGVAVVTLLITFMIVGAIFSKLNRANPEEQEQARKWDNLQQKAELAIKNRDVKELNKVITFYHQNFPPGQEPAGGEQLVARMEKLQKTLKEEAKTKDEKPIFRKVPTTLSPSQKLVSPDELTKTAYIQSYKNIKLSEYLNLLSKRAVAKNKQEVQAAMLSNKELKISAVTKIYEVKSMLYVDETGRIRGHKMTYPKAAEGSVIGDMYKRFETKVGENYLYKLTFSPGINLQGKAVKSTVEETFNLLK
jgi:low affinity Fe/Cu permease